MSGDLIEQFFQEDKKTICYMNKNFGEILLNSLIYLQTLIMLSTSDEDAGFSSFIRKFFISQYFFGLLFSQKPLFHVVSKNTLMDLIPLEPISYFI